MFKIQHSATRTAAKQWTNKQFFFWLVIIIIIAVVIITITLRLYPSFTSVFQPQKKKNKNNEHTVCYRPGVLQGSRPSMFKNHTVVNLW